MMHTKEPEQSATRRAWIILAVSAALVWSTQSGAVSKALVPAELVAGIPYARSVLASLSDAVVMILLVCLASGRSPASVIALAGPAKWAGRPLLWVLVWFVPALAVCLAIAVRAPDVSAADFAWQAVGGPVLEEIVYRGLAVGALVRVCGWRWWPACILPAVFFGAVHFWQGSNFETIAGVVAITTLGGVLFGWLFMRWGFNLLPPIALHIGLNGLWLLFDLGETAIGGWQGNTLRVVTVALAVGATFWLAPKATPRAVTPETAPSRP